MMATTIFIKHRTTILVATATLFIVYWYSGYAYWLANRLFKTQRVVLNPPSNDDNYSLRPKFNKAKLRQIPQDWIEENKCPACYGVSLCDEMKEERIKIEIPDNATLQSSKGVYFGSWNGTPVTVKRLIQSTNGFELFDQFICKQAQLDFRCDVSKAILGTPLAKKNEGLKVGLAEKAFQATHDSSKEFTMSNCVTDKMLGAFKDGFLSKVPFDKMEEPSNLAMMYTNLALNPEGLLLNFFTNDNTYHTMVFPQLYGACGRIVLVEDAGIPVDEFLKESWRKRTSIASSLMGIVEHFVGSDENWLILYFDMKLENFAVSGSGDVKVVDVEDVVVIDREKADKETTDEAFAICNKDCFLKMMNIMKSGDTTYKKCSTLMHHHQLMKALMCNDILSDLEEHRMSYISGKPEKGALGGLLHSPPTSHSDKINGWLKECVTETKPGGRILAWKELTQSLADFSVGMV